jgi:hypothetical protein
MKQRSLASKLSPPEYQTFSLSLKVRGVRNTLRGRTRIDLTSEPVEMPDLRVSTEATTNAEDIKLLEAALQGLTLERRGAGATNDGDRRADGICAPARPSTAARSEEDRASAWKRFEGGRQP